MLDTICTSTLACEHTGSSVLREKPLPLPAVEAAMTACELRASPQRRRGTTRRTRPLLLPIFEVDYFVWTTMLPLPIS